jgi:hypothetical protein
MLFDPPQVVLPEFVTLTEMVRGVAQLLSPARGVNWIEPVEFGLV